MRTLTAQETLIPATARLNIAHANEALWMHIDVCAVCSFSRSTVTAHFHFVLHAVLRDPRPYQLPHQCRRQRFIGGEANRAFAGLESFELFQKRAYRGGTHGIQGTMIPGRPKGDQRTAIQPKGCESVADALFGPGGNSAD